MNDEEAKAVQEVAKATGKGIDAVQGLGGFLKDVFGSSLKELGDILHDRAVLFRYKNMLRIKDQVERIHQERRNAGKTIPIPPRYAIRILEHASLEDDESVQNMWAGLIANASDPSRLLDLKKIYLDILVSLEPLDVAALNKIYNAQTNPTTHSPTANPRMNSVTFTLLQERLEIPTVQLQVSLYNLARQACIRSEQDLVWDGQSKSGFDASDVTASIVLTDLGRLLVEACSRDDTKRA